MWHAPVLCVTLNGQFFPAMGRFLDVVWCDLKHYVWDMTTIEVALRFCTCHFCPIAFPRLFPVYDMN